MANKTTQYSYCNIIPIPEAGNLNEVDNYIGIALFTDALKVTKKMILNRIQPFINPLLRNNQNRFSPWRSTTTYILAIIDRRDKISQYEGNNHFC